MKASLIWTGLFKTSCILSLEFTLILCEVAGGTLAFSFATRNQIGDVPHSQNSASTEV